MGRGEGGTVIIGREIEEDIMELLRNLTILCSQVREVEKMRDN